MSSNLKVLVIGAGLGGLTLAILLEQAGIPFIVIEKRSDFSPLGSSISLNQAVQPFFEQLGMLQEMEAISKPIQCMTFLKENMSKIGSLDLYSDALRYGYYNRITDRPSLYRLLLSRISPQNVVLNKRVADIKQGRDNVIVRCADGQCCRQTLSSVQTEHTRRSAGVYIKTWRTRASCPRPTSCHYPLTSNASWVCVHFSSWVHLVCCWSLFSWNGWDASNCCSYFVRRA
ncbi:MAG: hypothetical protein BYD32DRAFT_249730 [Podila humilis]|nr:MAG: hypothetical protein BYD32DRAFT_249730 [Podila humilis]